MTTPITTLMSFDVLPSCATLCGTLYDVNGACVPPAASTASLGVYASCFCNDARLTALSTGTAVCDNVCTTNTADLLTLHTWFSTWCASNADKAVSTSSTGTSSSSSSTSTKSSSGSSAGTTWLNTHWQWVIFIVVVVVGIAGIWIGACIWRRRYLRKKDRQYALGKSLAARASTGANSSGINNPSQPSIHMPHAGMFDPASISSANVYDMEKTQKIAKARRHE